MQHLTVITGVVRDTPLICWSIGVGERWWALAACGDFADSLRTPTDILRTCRRSSFPSVYPIQGSRRGLVKLLGNTIEIVLEETRVDIQSHRRRCVTERALYGLHVCSGSDRQTGSCVTQFVRTQVSKSSACDGLIEDPCPPVPKVDDPTFGRGEQQVVTRLALASSGERLDQEARNRDFAPLMIFR
jgi:hypothetical protein